MRARTDRVDSLTEDRAENPRTVLTGAGYVLIAFASSRLLIIAIMLLSQLVVSPGTHSVSQGLLRVLSDWDGGWYLAIAQDGYDFHPDGTPSRINFFPLYPLLIRAGTWICQNAVIAGLVISYTNLLAAGVLLNALMNMDFIDRRVREAAVTFFMFNPMSFFFSEVYSESTFLVLAIGALFAARRGYWLAACLCGMALSATRHVGVLIAIPLFIEFVVTSWDSKSGLRSLARPRILLLGLVPLGLGLFSLYCHLRFGNYLAFLEAGRGWGRELSTPGMMLHSFHWFPPFYRWLFGTALAASFVLGVAAVWLRLRASYLAFLAALVTIYLCANHLEAIPRYLSVVFPFYIVLGVLVTRLNVLYAPLLAASVALLTLCTILAANGYWMT